MTLILQILAGLTMATFTVCAVIFTATIVKEMRR